MKYGSIVAVLSLCSFAAADEARHPGYCDLSTATCWHPQTPLTAEEVARYADRACHSLHPCPCGGGGCYKKSADWENQEPIIVCTDDANPMG
ncbi:hypothetical protein JDV02_000095 [Purpureocillium takamizusanense]|uniref:Uncharacterized protein n=1 Tax=Purpureocillium takamizusanense TaxID=2060973 RepID=A0A9Q8Q431_9HYPO|nr:uncharacterized protein JDV02_000095 [Purpureocillium takamizusanense]UNI13343.1 hypothetical protein JDV02_000095 [Purpureocillium takamizusanense]